jgi:sec-independent protein translocase protein TatA
MLRNFTGWHALIVFAVVLLLFGAAKLPALAKSVGQSMRILKTEISDPEPAVQPVAASATASDTGAVELTPVRDRPTSS